MTMGDTDWRSAPTEEKPMGDLRMDKVVYVVPLEVHKMNKALELIKNQGLKLVHVEAQNTTQVRMVGSRE